MVQLAKAAICESALAGHPTLGSCHVWPASGGARRSSDGLQECEIGLVRLRRCPGRLSLKAPELRRSGPVKSDLLARIAEGLRLAPGAIGCCQLGR